jgi:N-acetylglucosamine kinase-like BadF-type ATPase
MDVGGTNIDCVAVSESGTNSEVHQVRPFGVAPEIAARDVLLSFIKSSRLKKSDLSIVSIGWKQGRNKAKSENMMRILAKEGIRSEVYWDAETAFTGAIPDKVGIVALSGTGSVIYGKTSKGKNLSSAGWSAILGDPGSAFAIGKAAITLALCDRDGVCKAKSLVEKIPDTIDMSFDELIFLADADLNSVVPKIASVAQLVFKLANQGDLECTRICDEAAKDFATHMLTVVSNWPSHDPLIISYAGRLMLAQPNYRQSIKRYIADNKIEIEWREPIFRPPYGAILMQYPKMLETIRQSSVSFNWHH